MTDDVTKTMLRVFAENRERSISQILLRDFDTPIYDHTAPILSNMPFGISLHQYGVTCGVLFLMCL